ncbi:MAG: hypothetical protein CSA65_03945 [Proteobacteria bacterium]|nr:MAG: hypothetical protein CSA65_03945 [Pseudomonadota bacterium]
MQQSNHTQRFLDLLEPHNELVERAALLIVGLLSWRAASLLWESGTTATSTLSLSLMLAGFLAGFAALSLTVVSGGSPQLRTWAIPIILSLVLACYAERYHLAQLENGVLSADVRLYMDYAARVLLHGENPYATDLYDAFRLNRAPFNLTTTLLDGDVTGRVAYPALSFLVFLPFQLLRISPDWVYPTLLVITLAVFYRGAPKPLRPLILLPLFVDPRYIEYALGGVSDIGWALLLVLMVHSWRSPRTRAVFYGLACAYKHQPWILAPFLLLRLWHEAGTESPWRDRARPLLTFVVLAVGAFALINVPFLLWSPTTWLRGVFEPVVAPMITFGQGLSALTMYGRVIIPKGAYSMMMVATLFASLWLYHRHYRQLRLLLWVAPGFLLWFSNRSLTSYWYFYLLPMLFDLACAMSRPAPKTTTCVPTSSSADEKPSKRVAKGRISWRSAALVALAWIATVLTLVLYYGSAPNAYALRVHYPIEVTGHHVRKLTVTLRNGGERPLAPRFTVQANGQQPFYWRVTSGPRVLRPGVKARYTLHTRASFAAFEMRRGARVTAADARRSARRVTVEIAPERTYIHPDTIPNGAYRFWSAHSKTPTFWGLIQQPPKAGSVQVEQLQRDLRAPARAPARALRFTLDQEQEASLALDTYLALPRTPVTISVLRPPGSNKLPRPKLLYGLRLLVDQRHVLILFGDEERDGRLASGVAYVMVRAPTSRWSRHRLDLPAILARLGLTALPRRVSLPRFEHLDLPCVPLNLELYVATTTKQTATALFGPLQASEPRSAVLARYPLDGSHRLAPLLWRGSYNLELRNYGKARAAFARAAKLAPKQASVHLKHGEAEFWLGRWRGAIKAFAKALELSPSHPLAYKGIGWAHYNLHEYPDALMAWRAALDAFDKNKGRWLPAHVADTLKGLVLLYLRNGECERARQAASRARRLLPSVALPNAALAACQE